MTSGNKSGSSNKDGGDGDGHLVIAEGIDRAARGASDNLIGDTNSAVAESQGSGGNLLRQ